MGAVSDGGDRDGKAAITLRRKPIFAFLLLCAGFSALVVVLGTLSWTRNRISPIFFLHQPVYILIAVVIAKIAGGAKDVEARLPELRLTVRLSWPFALIIALLSINTFVFHHPPAVKVLGEFALAAVLVAVTEEAWFRGLMLASLRPLGDTAAALATSTAFAGLHVVFSHNDRAATVLQAFGVFAIGLFFAMLTIRTRSIWPSIVLHSVDDFLVLASSTLDRPEPQRTVIQAMTAARFGFVIATLLGVFSLAQLNYLRFRRESVEGENDR